MAVKNTKRREAILTAAYRLFGDNQYDRVSLNDIAKAAGINKSLLQHYYTQKIEIVKTMLGELLETSSAYMEKLTFQDEELFQRISDFNMLFFKGVASDYTLRQFILSSVRQEEFDQKAAAYDERFRKADAKLNRLKAERQDRLMRVCSVKKYVENLRDQAGPIEVWNEQAWCLLVTQVTVHADGSAEFLFRGENRITVK